MPNQVKGNKPEEKFKGEVLGINNKLQMISRVFKKKIIRSLFVGNHDHKKKSTTVKQVGEVISLLEYI